MIGSLEQPLKVVEIAEANGGRRVRVSRRARNQPAAQVRIVGVLFTILLVIVLVIVIITARRCSARAAGVSPSCLLGI
jgi:hypothetical protein